MPLLSSTLLLRTHSLSLLTISYYLLTSPVHLLSSTPIWLLGESMVVRPAMFAPDDPNETGANRDPGPRSTLLQSSSKALGPSESDRELFALLALVLVVYAVTQFLFAGDLSLLPIPSGPSSSSSSLSKRDSPSGSQGPNRTSTSRSTSSSSSFAEDLRSLVTAQSRWLMLAGLHVFAAAGVVVWIYVFHSHQDKSQQAQQTSAQFLGLGLGRLAHRITFAAAFFDMLFWGYLWTVLKEEGREVAKTLARRREVQEEEDLNHF